MLRRRKRRTCPLAFCFFIGITLPYASILCTAVQVQNLSPAEKEVPPLKKLWTSPFVLFLREAIMLYFSRRVPQAAACLAYFVLLTVFPVLICVSYILGLSLIHIFRSFSPPWPCLLFGVNVFWQQYTTGNLPRTTLIFPRIFYHLFTVSSFFSRGNVL